MTQKDRSRFQLMIDHLRAAKTHFGQASTICNNIILDIQGGENYLDKLIAQIAIGIEDAGGIVDIEAEIKDFIPRVYRKPEQEAS